MTWTVMTHDIADRRNLHLDMHADNKARNSGLDFVTSHEMKIIEQEGDLALHA